MNVKQLNAWQAALDDASRNLTIEGLRLSIINALEAMAPKFDDENSELLHDEWCTDHSRVVAISVSYYTLTLNLSQSRSNVTSTPMQPHVSIIIAWQRVWKE